MQDGTCPHCDRQSFALKHPLTETEHFVVVCDAHPLCEGHILIIPKRHISCAGAFTKEILSEYIPLYERVSDFLKRTYGSCASFEHGIIGQTVYHAHVHLAPFTGVVSDIIPEGNEHLIIISSWQDVVRQYTEEGKYLYVSIGDTSYLVDTALGNPRFFRDRFAAALGVPERGNWRAMQDDPGLMQSASREIARTVSAWNAVH